MGFETFKTQCEQWHSEGFGRFFLLTFGSFVQMFFEFLLGFVLEAEARFVGSTLGQAMVWDGELGEGGHTAWVEESRGFGEEIRYIWLGGWRQKREAKLPFKLPRNEVCSRAPSYICNLWGGRWLLTLCLFSALVSPPTHPPTASTRFASFVLVNHTHTLVNLVHDVDIDHHPNISLRFCWYGFLAKPCPLLVVGISHTLCVDPNKNEISEIGSGFSPKKKIVIFGESVYLKCVDLNKWRYLEEMDQDLFQKIEYHLRSRYYLPQFVVLNFHEIF